MTDALERLTPAAPDDLADALAFALRFGGAGIASVFENCRLGQDWR